MIRKFIHLFSHLSVALFVLLCLAPVLLFSQSWKEPYNKFVTEFQSSDFSNAVQTGKTALNVIEKELGKKDTNYVNTLYYLQYGYYYLQQYDSAIIYAQEEQSLRKEISGTEDPYYLNATYNLGVFNTYLAYYSRAIPYMTEVVEKVQKSYGKKSEYYINYASQLANVYNLAGSYQKADDVYTDVYSIVKEMYTPNDSVFQSMTNTVAAFYTAHGDFEKSEPFYTGAVETIEKINGKLSNNYIITLNSLGEFYLLAGWYDKAEKTYIEFRDICEKHFGNPSADYATALNNLAVVYEKKEQFTEAEKLYIECLKIKEKVFKKESDYYALTLSNFAVLYDKMGKNDKARELLNEAVSIYKSRYGESSANYATALDNLASVCSNSGNYKEAIAIETKALAIHKKLYGEEYAGYITALNNLALLHSSVGQYDSSEAEFTKAAALNLKTKGAKHSDYATTLFNLANIKTTLGKYKEAESLLLKALQIQKEAVGENHSSYASVLNSLAGLYSIIGNYQKAEEIYLQCKKIYDKIYGDLHPEYATLLNNMGQFYAESGNYETAVQYLEKALKIMYDAYGKLHPDNISLLSNMANVYTAKGEYRNAEEYLMQALEIAKQKLGTNHPDYAASLNNLATLYYELGNYARAEKLYLEAAEKRKLIYGEKHTEYIGSLNNLGSLYMSMALYGSDTADANENAGKAEEYFTKALALDSVTLGTEHPDYAMHLNNLAELYRAVKEYEKAGPLYLQSLEIEKKLFGENRISISVTYNNLSLLYLEASDYTKAESYALKSLDIRKKLLGENHSSCATVMSSLGSVYESMGNYEKAAFYFTRSIDINYAFLQDNFSFLSESERTGLLKTVAGYNDLFNAFVLKAKNKNPELCGIVYNNEVKYKGLLLRSSARLKRDILASSDTSLINLYHSWTGIRQQLSKLYSGTASSTNTDSLEEQANLYEKKLVGMSAEFKSTEQQGNRDYKAILNTLEPGRAAIEFTHFLRMNSDRSVSDVYCALVLLPGNVYPEMIELFDASRLKIFLGKAIGSNLESAGMLYGKKGALKNDFYEIVWKPLDTLLTGINKIDYSPSGLLHKIAFSSIGLPGNTCLSDKYFLTMLSNTSSVTDETDNPFADKNATVAIFGGAIYSTDASKTEIWKYLEGTKNESDNISGLFAKANIKCREYTGFAASEDSLKFLDGKNSSVIFHLATHGFFYPDPKEVIQKQVMETGDLAFRGSSRGIKIFVENSNPLMRSGLVFSGANDVWNQPDVKGEDGVLTAYEVSNMSLQNTKLVVMSACETGLGDIKGTEGVYGLQRAFKIAGVKYLVMSLWQVPDKETSEFMISFYSNLIKLKNIRKAFDLSQKEMREKYDPYYWAAFVLME